MDKFIFLFISPKWHNRSFNRFGSKNFNKHLINTQWKSWWKRKWSEMDDVGFDSCHMRLTFHQNHPTRVLSYWVTTSLSTRAQSAFKAAANAEVQTKNVED